jgi:hypothetical protein
MNLLVQNVVLMIDSVFRLHLRSSRAPQSLEKQIPDSFSTSSYEVVHDRSHALVRCIAVHERNASEVNRTGHLT